MVEKLEIITSSRINLKPINPDFVSNLYLAVHPFSEEIFANRLLERTAFNLNDSEKTYLDRITTFLKDHGDACIITHSCCHLESLVERMKTMKPANLRYIVPTDPHGNSVVEPIIGWDKFLKFLESFSPERITLCGFSGYVDMTLEKLKQYFPSKTFLEEKLCLRY